MAAYCLHQHVASGQMTANDKMMVYLPGEVRRGLRIRAAEEGRRGSDVVMDAVVAYPAEPGRAPPGVARPSIRPTIETVLSDNGVMQALERQGKALSDLALRLDRDDGTLDLPQGSAVVRAMAVILAELTRAEDDGRTPRAFAKAAVSINLNSVVAVDALDILQNVGLIRTKGSRWYLGGPNKG